MLQLTVILKPGGFHPVFLWVRPAGDISLCKLQAGLCMKCFSLFITTVDRFRNKIKQKEKVNCIMGDNAAGFSKGNLVVYRGKTAIVTATGEKTDIKLAAGKTVKVRSKDIELLHEGPVSDFSQLVPPAYPDINELREVLEGETTTLGDLMELMFGRSSPAAANAVHELIQDGLYFTGTPDCVHVNRRDEFEKERDRRNNKNAEKKEWEEFMERVRRRCILETDHGRLHNLADVALGKSGSSRILKELKSEITPENAHQLLLDLEYWDYRVNPYIKRFGFSSDAGYPEISVDIDREERHDLTHLSAYAIDDEGNTDPDDAIGYDNGKLWIHVADVAATVRPDSPLDIYARSQAATLYLPEKKMMMLPEKIIEVYGLGLSEISPALSFGITFGENGEIDTVEILTTIVRVTRITYEQAEQMIDRSPLREMYNRCCRYKALRNANGAVTLNFPEVKIQVKNDSVQITPLPNLRSKELVTNAMLMAGEAAARFAIENRIPFLFTTQAAPDVTEIPEVIRTPKTFSEQFAFRKFLAPGQITSVAAPHAGLGLAAYSRATSPLRRYVDLIAHQQLRAFIKGQSVMDEQQVVNRVGAVEAIIGNAKKLERCSNRHWTLVYLMQHPNRTYKGIPVEKRERFSIVMLPELGMDSRIMIKENLELDAEIILSVKSIDLPRLEIFFERENP